MRSLVVIMLPKSKGKIPWLLYQKDLEAPLVLVRHLFKAATVTKDNAVKIGNAAAHA